MHFRPKHTMSSSGTGMSPLLFNQLFRVFCVFLGLPRLAKRAGLIPFQVKEKVPAHGSR